MLIDALDYKIHIDSLAESNLEQDYFLNPRYSSIFVIVDENTHEHCLSHVMYSASGLENAQIIELPSGEENKVIEICYHVWQTLTENNADRNSLIVNLGGGVISDMGGFIASTYKRGIDFINLPTTLLSQVDASVGGKVGIDFEGFKNQIGLFSNPKAVFIEPLFLSTLDNRLLLSGFAEMLKHGLVSSKSHWEKLKDLNFESDFSDFVPSLISDSVQIKNRIVKNDFKEEGERKLLNFGHTVGHAIESYYLNSEGKENLLHGEAIAIGMLIESILSIQVGLSQADLEEIKSFMNRFYKMPKFLDDELKVMLELMYNDKKNKDGKINFTLLNEIGKGCTDNYLSENKITAAFSVYNSFFQ